MSANAAILTSLALTEGSKTKEERKQDRREAKRKDKKKKRKGDRTKKEEQDRIEREWQENPMSRQLNGENWSQP